MYAIMLLVPQSKQWHIHGCMKRCKKCFLFFYLPSQDVPENWLGYKQRWESPVSKKKEKIRRLNDMHRGSETSGGKMEISVGIRNQGRKFLTKAKVAVAHYDNFTREADFTNEHSFGKVEVDGQQVVFQIFYYDSSMRMESSDPSNPKITTRVLVIMLESEY